jgi:hypothetical protein
VGLGYFLLALRFVFFAGFFFAAFFFAAMCAPLRSAVSLIAARRDGGPWCGRIIGDPAPRSRSHGSRMTRKVSCSIRVSSLESRAPRSSRSTARRSAVADGRDRIGACAGRVANQGREIVEQMRHTGDDDGTHAAPGTH